MDEAGVATVVDLTEGGKKTLEGLYEAIGCRFVDVVRVAPPQLDMWIDDEGLYAFEAMPNVLAEHIVSTVTRQRLVQRIVGAVVFAATNDEGETVSLDQRMVEDLLESSRRWQAKGLHQVLAERLVERNARLAEMREERV